METPAADGFRAGFVALLGKPNAGKSTLLNALLGEKLSVVSSKPQTTRHKILGLLNLPGTQIAFLDTPGLIAKHKDLLQKSLSRAAREAARQDADVLVLIVEPYSPAAGFLEDFSAIRPPNVPLILAVNKSDLAQDPEERKAAVAAWRESLKPEAVIIVSALKKIGIEALLSEITARLPESQPFYSRGQLSDRWERFFASEIIRGQVFALYSEEVPHATAVLIDEFRENSGRPDAIRALLFVERESQKAILIGKKGAAMRRLEEKSRQALEEFLGRRVNLELWIKVRKDWRKDPKSLGEFGYL